MRGELPNGVVPALRGKGNRLQRHPCRTQAEKRGGGPENTVARDEWRAVFAKAKGKEGKSGDPSVHGPEDRPVGPQPKRREKKQEPKAGFHHASPIKLAVDAFVKLQPNEPRAICAAPMATRRG